VPAAPPPSALDNAGPPAFDAAPPVPSDATGQAPAEVYHFRDNNPPPVPDEAPPPPPGEWSEYSGTPSSAPPPVPEQDPAEAFFNGPPPPVPATDAQFPPPAQPGGVPSFDTLTTRAYPVPQAALDAYAADPANAPPAAPYDDNAPPGQVPPPSNTASTRVAEIPQELLQAAAMPSPVDSQPGPRITHTGTFAAVAEDSEEQHFEEVFREFLATRERCGEPADGLTYDRFVPKLRKNKEQLVQKYNCKTVRFTVYVKDGKAALKATPVKE
jgi:hypothetical protein